MDGRTAEISPPPTAPRFAGDPSVAVLMGTKNGTAYLDAQLVSLATQAHGRIDIWVSDDGSTDETLTILKQWRGRWTKGRFEVLDGPCKGFAENYRSLICNRAIEADYYAFCDQDDVWEPGRLSAGIRWLRSQPADRPAMFCSRTLTMSRYGTVTGMSPLFVRPPSFRNALVQSIAGGNTMLFNAAARSSLLRASERSGFVSHDWWTYMILTGVGGLIHYSSDPLVRYRQHGANAFGQNSTFLARLNRMRRLFEGQFFEWTEENLRGLEANRDMLTREASNTLDAFIKSRRGSVMARLRGMRESGIYRQTTSGTVALALATALHRD